MGKKFWCSSCEDFTEHEFFKDQGREIALCLECAHQEYISPYCCPHCGALPTEDRKYCTADVCCQSNDFIIDETCKDCEFHVNEPGTLVEIKNIWNNHGLALEFGSSSAVWTEVHKCWHCGNQYEFENSNC